MLTDLIKPGKASKEEATKKRCKWKKGEVQSEKSATTSIVTHSASDTTRNRKLWTRILTSVGLFNCKPPVPCAFNSWWQLSLTAIGRFGTLPHSGWSGLHRRWPQFIQLQHMEQPLYNNDIISFISQWNLLCSAYHQSVIHNYALIKSMSIRQFTGDTWRSAFVQGIWVARHSLSLYWYYELLLLEYQLVCYQTFWMNVFQSLPTTFKAFIMYTLCCCSSCGECAYQGIWNVTNYSFCNEYKYQKFNTENSSVCKSFQSVKGSPIWKCAVNLSYQIGLCLVIYSDRLKTILWQHHFEFRVLIYLTFHKIIWGDSWWKLRNEYRLSSIDT